MSPREDRLLVYPPVVIAHIARDLEELLAPRIQGRERIEVHYSVQLNGCPHIGTIMSLATAFAAGEYLSQAFGLPAVLSFEALENAPAIQRKVGGLVYHQTFADVCENGWSKADVYLSSFRELLEYFSQNAGVPYRVLTYKELQAIPLFRRALLEVIDRQEEFIPFVAPSDGYLRIRFPCPVCSFAEKSAKTTRVIEKRDRYDITLESRCFEHGVHTIRITPFRRRFSEIRANFLVAFYVSSPIKAILGVGEFGPVIKGVMSTMVRLAKTHTYGHPQALPSGYFAGCEYGYALPLVSMQTVEKPLGLEYLRKLLPGFRPPQSYLSLNNPKYLKIKEEVFGNEA